MTGVTPKTRFAYAVGDLGINLYFMSAMTFLLIFYTDVFGLSAEVAAWVFLVARVIDAVTDPLMGYLADRTRSRWGKLRPYLLFGPVPLALISFATFTVPDFDDAGKIAWAYVTYILFGIIYTVVTIPYAAMTAVLTDNHHERTKLSTLRMACAFAGGWGVSVGMIPLVGVLGGGADGWMWTMALFGVAATALLWWTFAGTRERTVATHTQPISLAEAGRALITNPPLAVVILVFVLGMLAFTFRQASAPFYFKYNVGREELVSLYFSVTLGVMFLGLVAIPALSARLGKAGAIRVGAVIAMLGGIGFYLTPADNVVMVFVWGALLSLGGAPVAVLGWAMIPDTVEYAEWRTGARADGVIFSTASFLPEDGQGAWRLGRGRAPGVVRLRRQSAADGRVAARHPGADVDLPVAGQCRPAGRDVPLPPRRRSPRADRRGIAGARRSLAGLRSGKKHGHPVDQGTTGLRPSRYAGVVARIEPCTSPKQLAWWHHAVFILPEERKDNDDRPDIFSE